MPINIPMMPGRSNPLTSEGNENLDVDFVPPHIMEQQKVSTVCCPIACLLPNVNGTSQGCASSPN